MFKEYYGLTEEEQKEYDKFIHILYQAIDDANKGYVPVTAILPNGATIITTRDIFKNRLIYWENKFINFSRQVYLTNSDKKKKKYMMNTWKGNIATYTPSTWGSYP